MKKLIIFLFLLSTNKLLHSQSECKYKSYFPKVTDASFDAFSKNFESARIKYKEAFSEIDFPLGQDLRKALKVSKHFKDTVWIEELSIKLAKGGIPLSYFNDLKDYPWYPKFQSEYITYQEYYKSNFDLNLRQQILDLRTQDSSFNDDCHKWRVGKKQMSLNQLIDESKKIYDTFKTIYDKYGFPCEQKMGYYFIDDEVHNIPILISLVHIHQRGVSYLNEYFGEFVCDGKMRPEEKDNMIGIGGNKNGIEQKMKDFYERYKSKN